MGEKRYRALLIGNSVFAEDAAHLPRLEGPQKDVTLLHHALVNDRTGLFSEQSVRVLLEQPMRSMMKEIHTSTRRTGSTCAPATRTPRHCCRPR
jgi:hypothetical protein